MSWKKIHTPKKPHTSHKLFQNVLGQISICDWSGGSPDTTDDGPLIVRPRTVVEISTYDGDVVYHVPVKCARDDRDGMCWVDEECMRALWSVPGLDLRFDRDGSFKRLFDSVEWASGLPTAYC